MSIQNNENPFENFRLVIGRIKLPNQKWVKRKVIKKNKKIVT